MIILNKLNGVEFALNSDLIENIQETPDTTIKLTNGNVYIVKQSLREVIGEIESFRSRCFTGAMDISQISGLSEKD